MEKSEALKAGKVSSFTQSELDLAGMILGYFSILKSLYFCFHLIKSKKTSHFTEA